MLIDQSADVVRRGAGLDRTRGEQLQNVGKVFADGDELRRQRLRLLDLANAQLALSLSGLPIALCLEPGSGIGQALFNGDLCVEDRVEIIAQLTDHTLGLPGAKCVRVGLQEPRSPGLKGLGKVAIGEGALPVKQTLPHLKLGDLAP
jgi:hypothetical protein